MILLSAALAATPELRFRHALGRIEEELLFKGENYIRVGSWAIIEAELGAAARLNDQTELGGSVHLSGDGGSSVGAFAAWAPLGWTKVSPLVELRVSLSYESVQCSCIAQDDRSGLVSWGVMGELRPGIRFGFGARGLGIGAQGELRAAYRTLPVLPSANGIYAGGLIGGILTLDVPLGPAPTPSLPAN